MKLVWVAQDLHIGGGQRVICQLSDRLAARGHDIEILYPKGRGGFSVTPPVRIRACGLDIASPTASLIVNLPFLIAAVPLCDWVLCSMPVSALAGFVAGKLRGARTLYYVMNDERALFDDRSLIRSDVLLQIYRGLTDWVQRLPLTIAVNSRWTGTRVARPRGGGYPIVPHGVDLSVFKPDGPRLDRDDDFVIVTVGRRHRWKGFPDLVQALNRVEQKRSAKEAFQLWIVTQDDLDLSEAAFPIHVIKPQSDEDIAAAYRSADLMVHPSWFEGFGLPPLEAMACGTPAVITDGGGVREYAQKGQNCLLVPPRDAAALTEAIGSLMVDAGLRRRLAENGSSTAAQFTWERAADALEKVLTSPR